MITFLRGELLDVKPTSIVVGVNGIGYAVVIPLSTFDNLPPRGSEVTVLTHLHLKEDEAVLYGFMTEDERQLFRMLLAVTGIGPKIAIGILSGISPKNFCTAVSQGSAAALSVVPGIGRKKAERLIVELKDKIAGLRLFAGEREVAASDRLVNDAIMALVSLGYTRSEAGKAVEAAAGRMGEVVDLEALVREALRSSR